MDYTTTTTTTRTTTSYCPLCLFPALNTECPHTVTQFKESLCPLGWTGPDSRNDGIFLMVHTPQYDPRGYVVGVGDLLVLTLCRFGSLSLSVRWCNKVEWKNLHCLRQDVRLFPFMSLGGFLPFFFICLHKPNNWQSVFAYFQFYTSLSTLMSPLCRAVHRALLYDWGKQSHRIFKGLPRQPLPVCWSHQGSRSSGRRYDSKKLSTDPSNDMQQCKADFQL